jgi:hypothetical protein
MKLIDISPDFLNEDLALKICRNKELKRKYIRKHFGGRGGVDVMTRIQ